MQHSKSRSIARQVCLQMRRLEDEPSGVCEFASPPLRTMIGLLSHRSAMLSPVDPSRQEGAPGQSSFGGRQKKALVGALEKCAGEDLNLQALTGTTTSK